MKEKSIIATGHCFQESFQVQRWVAVRKKRKYTIRRLCRSYQKEINSMFSATFIGVMFVIGIWCFLVQLAEW